MGSIWLHRLETCHPCCEVHFIDWDTHFNAFLMIRFKVLGSQHWIFTVSLALKNFFFSLSKFSIACCEEGI